MGHGEGVISCLHGPAKTVKAVTMTMFLVIGTIVRNRGRGPKVPDC